MSYITPAQFREGLEEAKSYADSVAVSGGSGGSITPAYIVGEYPFARSWLSVSEGGSPLSPIDKAVYTIETQGDYFGDIVMWRGDKGVYRLVGKKHFVDTPTPVPTQTVETVELPDKTFGNTSEEYVSFTPKLFSTIHIKFDYNITSEYFGNNSYLTVGIGEVWKDVFARANPNVGGTYIGSTGTYENDVYVTQEMIDQGVDFKISLVSVGYGGDTITNGSITIDVPYLDYETNDYIFDITRQDIQEAFESVGGKPASNANTYSTDEIVIGTWIDGKPLYRKTFDNGPYGPYVNGWFNLFQAQSDICDLIHCRLTINQQNNKISYSFIGRIYNNYIQMYNNDSNWNGTYVSTITLEYTKTTD